MADLDSNAPDQSIAEAIAGISTARLSGDGKDFAEEYRPHQTPWGCTNVRRPIRELAEPFINV